MKKLLFVFIINILSLLFTNPGFSQLSFYKHYTVNDGLPSSRVYDLLQDTKGYVWFATENGVAKFDGYKFRNYNVKDGLPSNSTLQIYEGDKGRLWFLSY
ncbi:MAG: hypothetical protein K8R68_11000, partial [Bacteroidales bacterium]|nr:hypothetical protein [Bacteroidales bacterium]